MEKRRPQSVSSMAALPQRTRMSVPKMTLVRRLLTLRQTLHRPGTAARSSSISRSAFRGYPRG